MKSHRDSKEMTVEVKGRPDGGYLITARDHQQKLIHGAPIEAGTKRRAVKTEILSIIAKSATGGNQVTFERRSMPLVAKLFETGSEEVVIKITRPRVPAFPVTNDLIEIAAVTRSAESAA